MHSFCSHVRRSVTSSGKTAGVPLSFLEAVEEHISAGKLSPEYPEVLVARFEISAQTLREYRKNDGSELTSIIVGALIDQELLLALYRAHPSI